MSLALAADVTCTITNTAIAPKLTIDKIVDNGDTGSTLTKTSWTLNADGPVDLAGPNGHGSGTVQIGSYDLSEVGPNTYSASDWDCVGAGGTQNDADTVSLALAADVTCTITNTAIPSQFRLEKSAVESDGVQDGFVKPGDTITYTVTASRSGPAFRSSTST